MFSVGKRRNVPWGIFVSDTWLTQNLPGECRVRVCVWNHILKDWSWKVYYSCCTGIDWHAGLHSSLFGSSLYELVPLCPAQTDTTMFLDLQSRHSSLPVQPADRRYMYNCLSNSASCVQNVNRCDTCQMRCTVSWKTFLEIKKTSRKAWVAILYLLQINS